MTDIKKSSLKSLLRIVNRATAKHTAAKLCLDCAITELRQVCPHLRIAQSPTVVGSSVKELRVCMDCGIQEIAWPTGFMTLTTPGGTWFESVQFDKSKERRGGRAPTLYPMQQHETYGYRRDPHLDVSER